MTEPGTAEIKVKYLVIIGLFLTVVGWMGFRLYYRNTSPLVQTQQGNITESYSGPKHIATIYGEEGALVGETRSVFVDGKRTYISDTSNHRILVLDYNGNLLLTFGDVPQGDWSGLKFPYGLTVVEDRIFVADAGTMKLTSFDLEGNFVDFFAEDVLKKPINIVYKENQFFITDVVRQQIVIVDRSGNEVHSFGHYGKEGAPGELNYPNGLAVDDNGRIYVADTNNSRIQIFDKEGNYLISWRGDDGSSGGIAAPMNLSLGKNNSLYITDPITNRVLVLNDKGEIADIIRYVPEENGTSSLSLPTGIYVDSDQRLFISDTGNRRVVIFSLK